MLKVLAGLNFQQLAAGSDLVLQLSHGHDFSALSKAAERRGFSGDGIDRVR